MAGKKMPFDRGITTTAAAGSNDIEYGPVRVGRLVCIQHIVVENKTSAFTDIRLLKKDGAREYLLEEQDSPQAATLYWTDKPYYLTEGQYLIARCTGCTADDVLVMTVSGYEQIGRGFEP